MNVISYADQSNKRQSNLQQMRKSFDKVVLCTAVSLVHSSTLSLWAAIQTQISHDDPNLTSLSCEDTSWIHAKDNTQD